MKENYSIRTKFSNNFRSVPVTEWCKEYLGHRGTAWEVYFDYNQTGIFVFEKERDYLIFLLKWS